MFRLHPSRRHSFARLSIPLFACALAVAAFAAIPVLAQETQASPATTTTTEDAPAGQNPDAALDLVKDAGQAATNALTQSGGPSFTTIISYVAIIAAIFILPVVIGNYLARRWRMPDYGWKFSTVLFSLFASLIIVALAWPPKLGIDLSGGVILVYEIDQSKKDENKTIDMAELTRAISQRINPDGLKEVVVRPYGEQQVEIIIPEADSEEQKHYQQIISQQGVLEFRIVCNIFDHDDLMKLAQQPANAAATRISKGGRPAAQWVPVKPSAIDSMNSPNFATRERNGRFEVLVELDDYNVTGDYLTRAEADFDQTGRPDVEFSFDAKGAKRFGAFTGDNQPMESPQPYKRNLAIILDGELYSAPQLNDRISDSGQITGDFTKEETEALASVLTAGKLPAVLEKEPSSSLLIGPTLGADTIRSGVTSMLIASGVVVIFMFIYYRFAGITANLALALNVLLIVAFMLLFKAAFTLSGLAGLALTVGMAVDANVLIYERMREERQKGATLRMAIRNGFDRATTAIIDANVTTLITALVLYVIGSDQIRGFAITLILGLIMNLFTAVFCTRVFFDVAEHRRWIKDVKMMKLMSTPNIDFLGKRYAAIAFSLILIAIGFAAVWQRGAGVLDIDFTGGTSVELLFNQPQTIDVVRNKLESAREKLPDITVTSEQTSEGKRYLINTSQRDVDTVESELGKLFPNQLAVIAMNIGPVTQIPGAAATSTENPDAKAGARLDLPSETLLAQADDAQSTATPKATDAQTSTPATSGENAATETPEKPADATATSTPAEAKPADGATATTPDPFAGGSSVDLTFSPGGLKHNVIRQAILNELRARDRDVPFEVTNPDYKPGSSESYDKWTVRVALPPAEAEPVLAAIKTRLASEPFFPSSNKIGSTVAEKTQNQAIWAFAGSLALIIVYIWFRFSQAMFGISAVVAVIHDVLVALGAVAISTWLAPYLGWAQVEPFKISLPVVAAFLTIIGYSLNDTIVIFDRIREMRGKSPYFSAELVNRALNETLSRTILTSLTVFFVVVVLYFYGGSGIHAFAFTLVVGVIAGTFSTIYIASPILLWLQDFGRPEASRVSGDRRVSSAT